MRCTRCRTRQHLQRRRNFRSSDLPKNTTPLPHTPVSKPSRSRLPLCTHSCVSPSRPKCAFCINACLRLSLLQQLTSVTPQRQIRVALLLPQQPARVTPQRPEQRSGVPEHRHNDHEAQKQGRRHSDRWQHEDVLDSSIFLHRPGGRRRCQRSDPSECTQPCPIAPFFHQEVLKDRRCGSPTAARTPPAHKPPASMSSSAGRLHHEPFDERSAWKFPPGGSSPHWRPNSALFLKSGKSAKKTIETPHLQSERRDAADHPVTNGGDDNDLLRLDVVDFRAFEALCASKVDLVVKVSGVFNERIVLQLLLVPIEETKVSISDMTNSTWTPSQHACRAQKGPHSANSIGEAHRHALPNNQRISCAREVAVTAERKGLVQ